MMPFSGIAGGLHNPRETLRKWIQYFHRRNDPAFFKKYFQDDFTSSYPQSYIGAEKRKSRM